MPRVDLVKEIQIERSSRVMQLEGMFDVPPAARSKLEWHGDVPLDDKDWQVGLIVGPSGAGKSSIARDLFGARVDKKLKWGQGSVVDSFDEQLSMKEITAACQAVGFNTIPAWMRPFKVLSTGEQFRVDLARRIVESNGLVVVDEFTSVVDRQVAKIGSHAVQKYVRRSKRQFVAVTCHYDVVAWLRPDWILEPAPGESLKFEWTAGRWLQRPDIDVTISPVPYAAWHTFAPFHYLTSEMNRAAQCYALFVGDRIAAFTSVLHFPHKKVKNLKSMSRTVTLPDWQGLGLAFVLNDTLGACYRTLGYRYRNYPAHPSFIRSNQNSPKWRLMKRPGQFATASGPLHLGGRPCAVFEYVGEPWPDRAEAAALITLPTRAAA